jgi:translation initiation factor IF-1
MVKNTSGGTKTKGIARKHATAAVSSGGALRVPTNPLEQIVIVSKMLGNGMCEVFNNDDVRFIAHIRNKFKGRHRRSNDISVNSFILVGLREWEKPCKNVDVIFVYDHFDSNALLSYPSINIHSLLARTNALSISTNHNLSTIDSIDFYTDNDNNNDYDYDYDNDNSYNPISYSSIDDI